MQTPIARLRHSITDTDYQVLVFRAPELRSQTRAWFTPKTVASAWRLTGLARKILTKVSAAPA